MVLLTSASGVLALLEENDPELKVFALEKLNEIVDEFWAEISGHIADIESYSEDESFSHRELAALVASKVFYHLGELDDSLLCALSAGTKFNVNDMTTYTSTILAKAIDHYTDLRVQQYDKGQSVTIDGRLDKIVNRMFQHCFELNSFKQVAGIALETRRSDILKRAIEESGEQTKMLNYVFEVVMTDISNRTYRNEVLGLIATLYRKLSNPDHMSICQCYLVLDDAKSIADILREIFDNNQIALGYQLAFDLYERATQQFLIRVRAAISGANESSTEGFTPEVAKRLDEILVGDLTLPLYVEFLSRNNHTDITILKNTKSALPRSSVYLSAAIMSNSLMYAGTTSDAFLRLDVEWVKQANNWAKFNTVASLGVIHKGHTTQAMKILEPYLPKDNMGGSAYERGGGLYALGLICANHGKEAEGFLRKFLRSSEEVIQHGACLGLGLAALGTANKDTFSELHEILNFDSAVTGEAAALAMGLIMAGSGDLEAVEHMRSYARETQHEKIIRGLAVGIALTMYACQEIADPIIEDMIKDQDPIVRMSACHTIATAYAGTGENRVIKILLHTAVSDVSDDVRRSAVTALGFLLFRTPEHVPSVVSLLCESFNPHVRYGACMALAVSCAGTGLKEAISLIEPMAQDSVGFVRQGAFLALAMIMIQQPNSHPKSASIRKMYSKVIADKHEDVLARFGAIYAQGLIEAGGRNVTISLSRDHGHMDMPTIIGLLTFTQFWFWFPLGHFISLAFKPTAVICLNENLKMPKMELLSDCPPSAFAYPPAVETPKEVQREKVQTAVLSTTTKVKARSKKDGAMEIDNSLEEAEKKKEEEEAEKEKKSEEMDIDNEEKKKSEEEAKTSMLNNPARVVLAQLPKVSVPESSRYQPVRAGSLLGGIVIVSDKTPDQPADLIEIDGEDAGDSGSKEDDNEPKPPAPFEFNEEIDE